MADKIQVTTTEATDDRKAVEVAVDEDIARFDTWFQDLGGTNAQNDPLTKSERSIIKSFLYWKLFGRK